MLKFKTSQTLTLALCLSIALLSGCGFSLRGSADLPDELLTMQVASVDDNSELFREVRRALRINGVTEDSKAPYRLGIGREQGLERTLSVNSNARAGEYELELSVMFQLSQAGKTVMGPETIRITRVYLTDPENAVAKNEEAELIREEMRRELAQQVLFRLQSYNRL